MEVTDIVNVSINLSAVPASNSNFNIPILLVDHADVPIDLRVATVTKSDYATRLTADTDAYKWCAAFWGQNYNPALAYIGRWVSAASSPYMVFPAAAAYTAFTGVTTGALKIVDTDTPANEDTISSLDFSACTSMADVCTVIQTALQAIAVPNITGLDTATCFVDGEGRVVIKNSTTGASALSISAATPAAGIDLTGSSYLGAEFSVAGLDVEAMGTALNACLEKMTSSKPFVVCQRGGSVAQVVALSTVVNAMNKILILVCNDVNAKNSALSSDFGYQIEALGYQKVYMIYTEHTTQYPDASLCGEVLQRDEGSCNFALTGLTGVSESGLHSDGTTVIPLTTTERNALEAKGYDYLVKPSTITHLVHGLAAGGNEMRIMIGKAYMEAKVAEEMYAYKIANDVVTYSDDDILAYKGIIERFADIMSARKVLDKNTYIWNMPLASSFTAAQKATHTMTLSNVFSATVQSAVNDVTLTMSFTI